MNYYRHFVLAIVYLLQYLPTHHSRASENVNDVNIDALLPYPNGGHRSDVKSAHRYVRDSYCLPFIHGNRTHESNKPKNIITSFDVHPFVYDFKGKRGKQFGHHAIVKNPLRMLSVVEPAGTCKKHALASVRDTAGTRNCNVAVNAGFFDNKEDNDRGECFGNIISDSRKISDAGGVQNANFGIRKDGTVVIGYLTEDEVNGKDQPDNAFVQLVTGVGWVLRNGESYLEESQQAECRKIEDTGTLKRFFGVQSARTVVGYDENGYVHLVTFDGQTDSRGVSLTDVVKYLQSVGVVNAINLDGGGSTTFTINQTVVNYPGNQRGNELYERQVSTILCVQGESSMKLPEKVESLSYCCNRNYLLVIGLTVLIGLSMLLHVHLYTMYQSNRSYVRRVLSGQQQKEALQSLLNAEISSLSGMDSGDDELED